MKPSRFWVGIVAFIISFLARFALTPVLGSAVPYMFFFPGIVLSAWYGGLAAGLVTTALSASASLYFLRMQTGRFSPAGTAGWGIFVCVGALLSWLNHAFKRSELRAIRELQARTEYEEALRTSEERLALALQGGGGVGTWDWDVPNDRVYCDPEFGQLFSVEPARAVAGFTWAEFVKSIHADDVALVDARMQQVLRSGDDFAAEYRLLQKDGTVRWVYARGRCHLDRSGKPIRFPGVVFDITERKQAEEDLRRSNQELKRVNRELEEFAYVTSHDLQEPLRMVNIYTQLLVRRIGIVDESVDEYADVIRQGVARMETLLHDLLSYSRTVHTLEPPVGSADLSQALREALEVLQNQIAESGAVIHTEALPVVRGDVTQMSHVLQNLLSNALKYRKAGVTPEIRVAAERSDEQWTISVRDNGIGFEPQYAEQIFGLFKRLHKNEYPGTGLGLAICERIIERYGGRIWAESQQGEGATFFIRLAALRET